MCVSVCVCVCVSMSLSVCVTIVRPGRTLMKINNFSTDARKFRHSISNGIFAKIVHRDPGLLFESKTFETFISLKRRQLAQKIHLTADFGICHRMAALQNYTVFKGTKLKC